MVVVPGRQTADHRAVGRIDDVAALPVHLHPDGGTGIVGHRYGKVTASGGDLRVVGQIAAVMGKSLGGDVAEADNPFGILLEAGEIQLTH